MEEALKFASEQLAERGEESELVLEELERTLALLAFEDPEKSPYGDLLSYSHRQKVRYILNRSLIQVLMTRNLRHTYPWLYLEKKKCPSKMTLVTFLKC